jgi:hypothetical protein
MTRQRQRVHSFSKRFFVQSIFERRGLGESDLSISPREGIDFFAKRDEYLLLFPVEIRIDEAVQVGGETRKETTLHRHPNAHNTSTSKRKNGVRLIPLSHNIDDPRTD